MPLSQGGTSSRCRYVFGSRLNPVGTARDIRFSFVHISHLVLVIAVSSANTKVVLFAVIDSENTGSHPDIFGDPGAFSQINALIVYHFPGFSAFADLAPDINVNLEILGILAGGCKLDRDDLGPGFVILFGMNNMSAARGHPGKRDGADQQRSHQSGNNTDDLFHGLIPPASWGTSSGG